MRTDVSVTKKPGAKAGNPIELRNVDLRIRVEIEACIKIIKWRCVRITSPWVHVAAGKVFYDLSTAGTKILGRPRVDDMDIVIFISIFGFKFEIRIGITSFVNRMLQKHPPEELFDMAELEIKIETLRRKFVAGQTRIVAGNDYVEADVDGRFLAI